MKTEILYSEEITKEIALEILSSGELSKEEINEYLDVIVAINRGENVFNLITNKGEYLLYSKGNAITDTKQRYKKS